MQLPKFDSRISLGNMLLLVGWLISASVLWGATREDATQLRRDLDRHQSTLDRYQLLFEEMQKTQAAIVANNTMILQWLERNPPVTTKEQR